MPAPDRKQSLATILVVDDDPQLREMLGEYLEMAGYGVLTARHGAEGWEMVNAHHPQVVITDIVMPDSEGIEFVMRMRQLAIRPKVITISGGFANSDHYLKCARIVGADSTLRKPFMPDVLLEEVTRLLGDSLAS